MGAIVLGSAVPTLVAVLAAAAFGKLRDPRGFARAVSGYRVVPARLSSTVAWTVIAAEIAVVLLLVLPWTRRAGAGLSGALFAGLLVAQVSVLRRGLRVDCGCFGRPGRTTLVGPLSLARAGAMLALSVMAAFASGSPLAGLPLAGVYLLVIGGLGLVLRPGPVPVRGSGGAAAPRGPRAGDRFVLGGEAAAPGETTLFALVAPTCGTCLDALPAFAEAAEHVRVVVVSPSGETSALRRDGLPSNVDVVVDPDVFDANGLPLPPFAVLTDASGTVLTSGRADSPGRPAALLHAASAALATTTPTPPAAA
ncbi:MauE/DoxX family redox-associated membrane protein [Actinomadura rupiterrae]|uniref:MauE/DoxX family redox-associated membrane protein n=1 Tax=Actinomadura rupiterrae TaxID=559627 RepID=UPI0020A61016|nr:MauE/DoxX family redox-associated membrane protein [Actinomadura rupiterrae]MCP2339095.1 thiol-disulfide isomerase/thioredoxin [Actinomadura rupiterrae]